MPQKFSIQLVSESAQWKKVRGLAPRLDLAAEAVISTLPASLKKVAKKATFAVLLTNDKAITKLNHDWRGKKKATNVLSFPQIEPEDLAKQKGTVFLGDIAFAYEFTLKEASSEKKKMLDHTTHLFIHGMLHLLGYDHILADEADHMEEIEVKIMKKLGLNDPYAL